MKEIGVRTFMKASLLDVLPMFVLLLIMRSSLLMLEIRDVWHVLVGRL